ncbi:hypothetical protein LTS15_002884 [Exophiala xenobiotica]|nr:hypothetical protein LTS15_002884 [Exophiala xenobiotica]
MCNKDHFKIHQAESVQMLHNMLQSPDEWMRHLKRFCNSIITTKGQNLQSNQSTASVRRPSMLRISRGLDERLEIWARVNEFGATAPVDIFRFLKLIPERFLGNWVIRATVVHDQMRTLYNHLRETVLKRRKK